MGQKRGKLGKLGQKVGEMGRNWGEIGKIGKILGKMWRNWGKEKGKLLLLCQAKEATAGSCLKTVSSLERGQQGVL